MTDLKLDCAYCPPNTTLLESTPSRYQDPVLWRRAWKRVVSQGNFGTVGCNGCGSAYTLVDDGIDPDNGGLVVSENTSTPRILGLNSTAGSSTGGEAVFVMGTALDIGTLVVKFDGKPVQQISKRTSTSARVVTPPGAYRLHVSAFTEGQFVVGEPVSGNNSLAKGVVRSIAPFIVDAPTRQFTTLETVVGEVSGAQLVLNTIPYSGAVDVTVENEHGTRLKGGNLVGGFTYL